MTWSNRADVVTTIKQIMMESREAAVKYMTPLGLHHIMGYNHHYGPGPWVADKPRADWTSVYYHQADEKGIGFNRTSSGSNAVEQYQIPVQEQLKLQTVPDKYLLWFHHVPWDHKMRSGKILWDDMCYNYSVGVETVRWMGRQWSTLEGKVDGEQFRQVNSLLKIQEKEALWWRNACLLYFQTFSKRVIPADLEKPEKTLEYYQSLEFPFAPGIKPKW
jgi:alpha-glucuronidase